MSTSPSPEKPSSSHLPEKAEEGPQPCRECVTQRSQEVDSAKENTAVLGLLLWGFPHPAGGGALEDRTTFLEEVSLCLERLLTWSSELILRTK